MRILALLASAIYFLLAVIAGYNAVAAFQSGLKIGDGFPYMLVPTVMAFIYATVGMLLVNAYQRRADADEAHPPSPFGDVLIVMASGLSLLVLVGVVVATFAARVGVMRPPATPYALDDSQARARVTNGKVAAKFPKQLAFQKQDAEVNVAEVVLDVPENQPGYNSQLRIYEPSGQHASGSLGCVLIGPAGATPTTGAGPLTENDEAEALPYAKAGFAVVAFGQDGELEPAKPTPLEHGKAVCKFFASQAGLVNARNALEFVLARMPEVDPQRIYVAGHSSAGTLALLFAEHEPRLHGCLAYAPLIDVVKTVERRTEHDRARYSAETLAEMYSPISPLTHAAKLNCPVLLFHAEGDRTIPAAESRAFADKLQSLGKTVRLVTVPGGDHQQSLLTAGIPAGIDWLEHLDKPGALAARDRPRATEKPPRPAVAEKPLDKPAEQATIRPLEKPVEKTVEKPTADLAVELYAKITDRQASTQFVNWVLPAERLSQDLIRLGDEATRDSATIGRATVVATQVKLRAQAIVDAARTAQAQNRPAPLASLPEATRRQVIELNTKLSQARDQIAESPSPNAVLNQLVTTLGDCILPAWLIEGRPAADEPVVAAPATATTQPTSSVPGNGRDYRDEAKRAMLASHSRDAIALLRADFLTQADRAFVEGMKWSPALNRPLPVLQWAFGVELKGGTAAAPANGAGPANLHPPGALAPVVNKSEQDRRLADELRLLTGDTGNWLAQGLQYRIDAGKFGDWGQTVRRNKYDHRGVTLLEVAPLDNLLDAALAEKADVLMLMSLTISKTSNAALVQLYDVQSGQKLWESKPLSNARIASARRQGKDLTAELAETVLEFIDDELLLRDPPKLSAKQVKERLDVLGRHPQDDLLTILTELRYLHLTRHLGKAGVEKRLTAIVGEEVGKRLVSDDEGERRNAIDSLLPAAN